MTRSGVTSTSPSGLAAREATFATNFVGPMPTEQVMLLLVGHHGAHVLPDHGRAAVHPDRAGESRNASSIDADSTIEVTDPKTLTIALDTAE